MGAGGKLQFLGGVVDNRINPLPDQAFLDLGFYTESTADFSDQQYAVQTDLNTFYWADFDAQQDFCQQNNLARIWYGVFESAVTDRWLSNWPTWTGAQIVQATTNYLAAAAVRSPNIKYINYINEGAISWDPTQRFAVAFGGAGSTGFDCWINLAKLIRQYFPNARLGVNDFQWESAGNDLQYTGGAPGFSNSRLPQMVTAVQILRSNGAIDWVGGEGYALESVSSANLDSAMTQVGQLGVDIILTEFTPYGYTDVMDEHKQLAAWQRLLPVLAANPYVIGIEGPWRLRKSLSVSRGINGYLVDDTVTPYRLTPTALWLKSYIPSITGPPTPPTNPISTQPPSPIPPQTGFPRAKQYPSFSPKSELSYQVGNYPEFVPPWLADTVMIHPYGEYGMAPYGVYTRWAPGGYWVNAQSVVTDPAYWALYGGTDLTYLVKNDLKLLPGVKRVIIALHWYTSLDHGNVANGQIVPAIGPEVQQWNWVNPPPAEYSVYPWTRANAYYLKYTHQVWATPDDNALLDGIRYLQAQGYQVGLCPIATLMSNNLYFAGGGEWQVDRSSLKWAAANIAGFNSYIQSYDVFYRHYINLLAKNNINPWIFYLGYGMRDITGCGINSFLAQFVSEISSLASYSKQALPHTKLTYAADLDEYYYSYLVRQNNCNLDPLWTCPDIDFVGVNWFAPLAIDDTENSTLLRQGVLQNEASSFYLPNFSWRAGLADRLISNTTRNFKTGLAQTPINPRVSGVKDIVDWLTYYHYYPAVNGMLSGVTPLANLFPGDPRLSSNIRGTGPIQSTKVFSPGVGGIAPVPDLKDTWLKVSTESYVFLNLPSVIPDNTQVSLEFIFEIDPALTDLTQNYQLFANKAGTLAIASLAGTITLWLPLLSGTVLEVPLFTDTHGDVLVVMTAAQASITVDGALDMTVTPPGTDQFKLPAPLDYFWMGNPVGTSEAYVPLPPRWQGKIYYFAVILGNNTSGGQYYFDDTYCGVRTAWNPSEKLWMATSFGYGSVRGSAADPQTRAQVIIGWYGTVIPNWYEEYTQVTGVRFRANYLAWNIQGPYGSDFAIDDVYQAICLNAAAMGIIDAGAQHQVAWFFDTRSGGAYKAILPNGYVQCGDGYDYDINSALNGKAAVRYGGTTSIYQPYTTVSEDLGLSVEPGDLPYQKVILVEPGVPQV